MRAGFGQFNVPTDEYLQFAAQFGATDVLLNTPQLPGGTRWEQAKKYNRKRPSGTPWGRITAAAESEAQS